MCVASLVGCGVGVLVTGNGVGVAVSVGAGVGVAGAGCGVGVLVTGNGVGVDVGGIANKQLIQLSVNINIEPVLIPALLSVPSENHPGPSPDENLSLS